MDKTLLLLINRDWTNPALDSLMATITNFSVWLPLLVLAGLLLLWKGGVRMRSFVVVTLVSVGLTDGVFTQFTKKWVHRARPHEALAGVREVSLRHTHPAFFGALQPPRVEYSPAPQTPLQDGGRSFPSGHAMNNAVIATTAVLFFRRWGWLYAAPAALVAYSRVYCGSHWPSDVAVSAALGIVFAWLLAQIYGRLYQGLGPRWFADWFRRHPDLIPGPCP
ncbi:MAG: phosphatase PAP2 family protein [Verrucomicrobia bacterium]|nr:phosphatase PAP2 family protein [Verrucomicrobiota bacterium]